MPQREMLKIDFPLYSIFGGAAYDFSTIKNGELFLSYPDNFNDPFDGAILIDQTEFLKEVLRRRFNDKFVSTLFSEAPKNNFTDIFEFIKQYNFALTELPDALIMYSDDCSMFENIDANKLKQECLALYNDYIKTIRKIRNEYGVACFTTNTPETNMVMWAHYADNYKGFCCKFEFDYYDVDTPRDKKGTGNILKRFHKVTYTKQIPFIDVKEILKYSPEELGKSTYIHRFIEKVLTLKHEQWSYENEYRIIIHKDSKLFKKTFTQNKCGFKISFPYLKALYISFEKCIDETGIKDIAITHKVKYYLLTPSKVGVQLVEDGSVMNIHNIMLDTHRILNTFTSLEFQEREFLPF